MTTLFNSLSYIGPGPVPPHPLVQAALSAPTVVLGTPGNGAIMARYRALTAEVLGCEPSRTTMVAGSGTVALEACLGALLGPGAVAVVCNNGYFSGRLVALARQTGAQVHEIEVAWGSTLSVEELQAYLTKLKRIGVTPDLVAVAHGETATGMLNPIEELGELVQRAACLFLVDAVSTVGGYNLDFDSLPIDVLCGAGQKCLGSVTGISPIAVSERAMQRITERAQATSWMGDLSKTVEKAGTFGHPFRATPPLELLNAYEKALERYVHEGRIAAASRHQEAAHGLSGQLLAAGWNYAGNRGHVRSCTTAVLQLPARFDEQAALSHLAHVWNMWPGRGIGPWTDRVWRIGVMAELAQPAAIEQVGQALRSALAVGLAAAARRPLAAQ